MMLGHPAERAWKRLGCPDVPVAIEDLKRPWRPGRPEGRKTVARLAFGAARPAVIAKRGPLPSIEVERRAYAEILPRTGVRVPGFVGFLGDDEATGWLFLESVDGAPVRSWTAGVRRCASESLARVHVHARGATALASLPDRGPDHYATRMRHIRAAVATTPRPARLGGVLQFVDRVERVWPDLWRQAEVVPATLAHGDLVGKNVLWPPCPDRRGLVVVDWGKAGRAVPLADLARLDMPRYRSALLRHGEAPSLAALERAQEVGRLARFVAAIDWTVASWARTGGDSAPAHLADYLSGAHAALRNSQFREVSRA